jgi:AcrR family transcriptional regulator
MRHPTTIRREQIAEAALTLVAEQGIAALTARNVARAIGVTAPALYRHFPGGMTDILESVLDLLDAIKADGIQRAQEATGTTLHRLRCCFDVHLAAIQRYRALPVLILSDSMRGNDPHFRHRLMASHARQEAALCAIIQRGQERGEIRDDIPAQHIFIQFLGQILSIAVLSSRMPAPDFDPIIQAESSWRLFVRSLAP